MGKRITQLTYVCAASPWVMLGLCYLALATEGASMGRRLFFWVAQVKIWVFSMSLSIADFITDSDAVANLIDKLGDHRYLFDKLSTSVSVREIGQTLCVIPTSSICSSSSFYYYGACVLVVFHVVALVTSVIGCMLVHHHWKSGERHGMKFKSQYIKWALFCFSGSSFFMLAGFVLYSVGLSQFLNSFNEFLRFFNITSRSDPGFQYVWFMMASSILLSIMPILIVAHQEDLEEYDPDEIDDEDIKLEKEAQLSQYQAVSHNNSNNMMTQHNMQGSYY